MRRFIRDNGLSAVWLALFLVTLILGQAVAGRLEYNSELKEHGQSEVGYVEYLASPHFFEATMENWESEFLQMFLFIVLTAFLYQKGSAESKKPGGQEAVDRDPRLSRNTKRAPWPVRHGGWLLRIYEHSLSLAFLLLFALSFIFHAISGARAYNHDQLLHGQANNLSAWEYACTARFWFESFQNWQSEFLAVGAMVLLSIWLRQRGSPESKPVDAPHAQTGKE